MRQPLVIIALALGAFWTAPSVAAAYVLETQRGEGRTISYYNGAPEHGFAVSEAVRAWNESGADVELVPAPREEAELVISLLSQPGLIGGQTSVIERSGGSPGFHDDVRPGDSKVLLPRLGVDGARSERFAVALVAAHELGHVLGLGHEDSFCATMNSTILNDAPAGCPAPATGQWRCRLLEKDDVRGVVELYGGEVLPVRRSPFCDKVPRVPPPVDAVVLSDPVASDEITLEWRNSASRHLESVVVSRARGSCPSSPGGPGDRVVEARPGEVQTLSYPLELESFCYAIWSRDSGGRLSGEPTTAVAAATPPPAPPDDLSAEAGSSYPFGSLGTTSLSWRNPDSETLIRVVIARAEGRCPARPPQRPRVWETPPAVPGALQEHHDFGFRAKDARRYCYVLWAQDKFGRYSDSVEATPRAVSAQGEVVLAVPPR